MADKRDLELGQYGISKYRYRELSNFCLQYKEFKKERLNCYSLDGSVLDGMPRGNYLSDPTMNKAEKAIRLGNYIELIEQTAIEACGDLYPYIIKAVTEGLTWDFLLPPCGRRQFYNERRKFFFLLNKKR